MRGVLCVCEARCVRANLAASTGSCPCLAHLPALAHCCTSRQAGRAGQGEAWPSTSPLLETLKSSVVLQVILSLKTILLNGTRSFLNGTHSFLNGTHS